MKPNIVSYCSLLNGYANNKDLNKVIEICKSFKEGAYTIDISLVNIEHNDFSYAILIKAYVMKQRVDDAYMVFDSMLKREIKPNQVDYIVINLVANFLFDNIGLHKY